MISVAYLRYATKQERLIDCGPCLAQHRQPAITMTIPIVITIECRQVNDDVRSCAPVFWCSTVSVFMCSCVAMFRSSCVPLFLYVGVPLFLCVVVVMVVVVAVDVVASLESNFNLLHFIWQFDMSRRHVMSYFVSNLFFTICLMRFMASSIHSWHCTCFAMHVIEKWMQRTHTIERERER